MTARAMAWMKAVGPLRAAFIGSLLLSLAAIGSGPLLNRDGILYVETAQSILEQGFAAQRQGIDWQFLPILMAGLAWLTGLSLEMAGHLINAFLLAGACGLAVAITRQRMPEAAWTACLVVLAMPAYNGYRNELLREHGFWFFSLLAFWLAMRWQDAPRWREAIACQLAIGIAALFRLEAVAFYPALLLWQAFAAPAGQRLRCVIMLGCVPFAGILLSAVFFGTGVIAVPDRVTYYLNAANPQRMLKTIGDAAARMSEQVFPFKYSREEAGYILFFGLLSVIPVKFLKMAGVFAVPLAYALVAQPARAAMSRWQPLPWAFLAYALVLVAFVTHQFFLVGRYVSMLNLLAVPLAAAGLVLLLRRFPRWKVLMLALALLTMAANVVSLAPRKTHIVEAGRWLGANVTERSQVCLANSRIAYYAGWRAGGLVQEGGIDVLLVEPRCAWIAVEARKKEDAGDRLQRSGLREVRRFENAAGDAVIIARREAAPPASVDRR